jgi:hypothetical protein
MPRPDEDNIQISHRVTAVCLSAIEQVFDAHVRMEKPGAIFEGLTSEQKRDFLSKHGKEILDICMRDRQVGMAFTNKVVLWVENEEQGTAGIVLTKRKPYVRA